jgi:phosphatidylglycerophosphate synthase
MRKTTLIPAAISSWRIAVLPPFFFIYNTGNTFACLVLFVFSAGTDLLDGYSARKLKVTSRFGTYYDAVTDFALIIGIYTFFTAKGFYPIWLVLLIAASFIQFLATSPYAKKIYDPVGRYIGSALYVGIVLTLAFPAQATFSFVQYAFIVFLVISLASRTVSLAKNRNST